MWPMPWSPKSLQRLELCSINASLSLLLSICISHNITSGSLTLFNDCKKAHKLLLKPGRKFKRFLLDDYDLLVETRTVLQDLWARDSLDLQWVKSHYNRKQREIQHDLNNEAHWLATSCLSEVSQLDDSPPSSLVTLNHGHSLAGIVN